MKVRDFGVFAMVAAGLVSQTVFAETKFDDEQTAKPVPAPVVKEQAPSAKEYVEEAPGKVTEIGSPKKGVSVLPKGAFGKDVSVLLALKQITPSGWQAKKNGQVDVSKTVSWKGGRPWVEILGEVASAGKINVEVNWDSKTLVVSQPKAKPLVVRTSEAQKVALPKRWELLPNKTLRENIEAWAASTSSPHWSVAWDAANYQIKFPATFTGEFDDDQNGPIPAIMEAFRHHDIPLRAEFQDDNHVLKIENAVYTQQGDRLKKLESGWNGQSN